MSKKKYTQLEEDEELYGRNRRKKKKKKSKVKVLFTEVIVLLLLLVVLAVYQKTFGQIDFLDDLTDSEAGINDDANLLALEGYTNIALFGLDNRSSGDYDSGNSDTIIIASINNETKEVQLVSVYRDTLLSIGNGKYRKANAAYAKGGATQAVAMLNTNLDLDITEYVCVDWVALVEAIDALGGVDIEIASNEITALNECIPEIDWQTGYSTKKITESGLQHLDGTQATAYARIRSTSGDDYLRSSRQRIVLQAMLSAAKEASLSELTTMCTEIFDDISTTLSVTQLIGLAKDVASYEIVSTTGFPYELTTKTLSTTGSTIVPVVLENNVEELHYYLFGEENYVVSDTVKLISDSIIETSGVDEDYENLVDTSLYNETVGADGTADTKEQNKETSTED